MKKELENQIKEEGNEESFVAYGMDCLVWRHPRSGHWCGYVKIPKDTKLYRSQTFYYSDSELGLSDFEKAVNSLDVHGGITFSGCPVPKKDSNDFYFGFDCAHSCDVTPFFDEYSFEGAQYRSKKYTIEQCSNLALQLKKIIETYK